MVCKRPFPHPTQRSAPYRISPSRALWLSMLLTILFSTPTTWAAGGQTAKAHPAKEKTKAPAHAITFDYSMGADGHNELLILCDAPMKNYKTFLLANPTRLVLDIPGVDLNGNTVDLPVNGPELSRIRIARHPDKVRIVFDLAEGQKVLHKVIEQDKGLKVLLSLEDGEQPPPRIGAAANPDTQEPADSTPVPIPAPTPPLIAEKQIEPPAPSDFEKIFGSQLVNVIFHKTPIRDFARYLSEKSGRHIEVSPDLTTSVSLKLTEVPLHVLVRAAAETIGFVIKQEGEQLILHPADPQASAPPGGQKKGEAS